MQGLTEYLNWRGDLSMLTNLPNEIDLLIFSQLVHAPLEKLTQLNDSLLRDLTAFIYPKPLTRDDRILPHQRYELWMHACKTERFSQVKLSRFESRFNASLQMQFAAALFTVGDIGIVTFRGTDATLTGWKEDFNLAFEDTIPAQEEAVDFLNQCGSKVKYLYICGHSKGGNLALYAATHCHAKLIAQMVRIISFDGPGLNEAALKNSNWQMVKHLVHTYIPESSIVGMLFSNHCTPTVVISDSVSILQHNPFFWHVMGAHFVEAEKNTSSSRIFDDTVDYFLHHCTPEQRRTLVDTLYDVLNASKAKYIRDIPIGILRNKQEVLNVLRNCSEETRKELSDIGQIVRAAIGDSVIRKRLLAVFGNLLSDLAEILPFVDSPQAAPTPSHPSVSDGQSIPILSSPIDSNSHSPIS